MIILQRKLSIPSSGILFTRSNLIEKLNHYSKSSLTVICAPAGYGKTSLVCNWLQYADHPVYWLSLDEQNNLPSSFWTYFYHCLRKIDNDLGDEAETILENHCIDDYCRISDLILASLEKLGRKWNRPHRAVIVLDDFQYIDNPLILTSFNRLLDYLPNWLQIVITTRKIPALKLPNRCSKSTAYLIQASELVFEAEHIADFLKMKLDLQLSKDQLQHLFMRTEGWAAAIQLTGLALKAGISFEDCTNTQDSLLAEFLFDEVFSQLNHDIQTLLVDISLVPHFNLELCQSFNNSRDNEAILTTLINQGLFISKVTCSLSDAADTVDALQHSQPSFRLHSLFRQWITEHRVLSPVEEKQKNKVALNWLTNNRNLYEALELSLKLEDWQVCSKLMGQLYPSLTQVTHFDHVSNILERIPEDIIQSLPHLCMLAALIGINLYDYECVEKHCGYLENHFEQNLKPSAYSPAEKTALTMGSMILRAQVARFSGDIPNAKIINQSLETRYYQENTPLNCWIMLGKGTDFFLDDNITEATKYNNTALSLAKEAEDGQCCISSLSWLLHSLYHQGNILEAISLGEKNIIWLKKMEYLTLPNSASVYAAMSVLYLEINKLDLAWQCYDKLLEMLNEFTEPRETIHNKYHTLFHLLSSTGRYDEARTCLHQLQQYEANLENTIKINHSILLDTETLSVLLDSKMGNSFSLLQHINNNNQDDKTRYRFRLLFEKLIQAAGEMVLSAGESNSFTDIAHESHSNGNYKRKISCYLVPAKILMSLGEEAHALTLFKIALESAAPFQFINLIIEDTNTIKPMLQKSLELGIESEYCNLLLAAINEREKWASIITHNQSATPVKQQFDNSDNYQNLNQGLVEILTHREMEVLSLINQGYRNKNIAESLSISISTVKRHLQNIYQKLQVSSRTEAITFLHDHTTPSL